MENQIKRSLDKFTDHHPVGKWMKSIHGIGPVIAAGMLAHIDIEKAPTAGHIWRYAGLDPTVVWLSKEVVTKTINEHCDEFGNVAASEGARESRMTELRRIVDLDFELDIDDVAKLKRMPGNLRQLHDEYQSLLNFDPEALKGLRKNQRYVDRDTVRWCCSHFGRNYDTLMRYMTDKETGEIKLNVTSLANAVVRRPWNGELKVLCVHPSCRVTTKRGYLPIKDVEVGDQVLTHKGNWHKVTKVFVNDFEGEMRGVALGGIGNQVAWLTPYHPIYATRPAEILNRKFVGTRARKIATEEQVAEMREMRQQGFKLREIAKKFSYSQSAVSQVCNYVTRTQTSKEEEVGWARADAVVPGWWGFVPKRPLEKEQLTLTLSADGMLHAGDNKQIAEGRWEGVAAPRAMVVPKEVKVTSKLARLVGLFLAEGNVTSGSIAFSFHIDEIEYHEFVIREVKKIFGLTARVFRNENTNSTQISFGNRALAKTFARCFGTDSYTVSLPLEWMSASTPVLVGLLRGLWEGDKFTTVSQQLGYQILDMCRMLGVTASMFIERPQGRATVFRILVQNTAALNNVLYGHDEEDERYQPYVAAKREEKTGTWLSFKESRTMDYSGKVYNLEVEDDESYVVESMAVHNCWKAGQSFMKTHNHKDSVYGHLYAQQKLKYQNKNMTGGFAERAARELNDYDPSTEAYGHLKEGRLPPANIDGMARRWAVKIFLSHVHHVMYWNKFGEMPPKPFAIAHLEHAHMITVPTPDWAPFQ